MRDGLADDGSGPPVLRADVSCENEASQSSRLKRIETGPSPHCSFAYSALAQSVRLYSGSSMRSGVALVFIGEHSFQPVGLMLGDD
jgi:hypothetical protein